MKKWFYELVYRFVPVDWIFGSTSKIEHLAELAINERISPGKAITLGCGVGRETIYLAKKGFDVIGVDFSSTAIKNARRKATAAGVDVQFIEDDLTNLKNTNGTYDMVMDFGALNDMSYADRDLYMKNVLPLIKSDGHYIMFSFTKMLPFEEILERFEKDFSIEVIREGSENRYPGALNLYLMARKE